MATSIKISQLPAKGANLEATDLLEVSEFNGTGYVSKSITGAEIIDSIPASSVEWGDITGTLSAQTDLNTALSGKVPTTRTLTINGTTQDLSADRTFTISTGITIGTTAITSGTVGRVLFEGTGNVVQESGNLTWDNANSTFGINGIIRCTNSVGTNRSTDLRTSNSIDNLPTTTFYPSSGTNVGQSFQVIPRGTGFSAGIKAQFALSGTDTIADGTNFEAMVVRATGSAFTFSSGKGGTGVVRPMLFSAGFLDGITNANQLWLYSTGNIGINTTTDAGFKLDVNGTARVQGDLTIQNNSSLSWGNGNFVQVNNANPDWKFYVQSSLVLTLGQTLITFGVVARTRDLTVSSDNSFDIGGQFGRYRHGWFGGQLKVGDATAVNASAKVQIDSTTQGFLPPRMTTTQKNAIATPTAGLVVYDTTLNKLCVRTASAWETITSL